MGNGMMFLLCFLLYFIILRLLSDVNRIVADLHNGHSHRCQNQIRSAYHLVKCFLVASIYVNCFMCDTTTKLENSTIKFDTLNASKYLRSFPLPEILYPNFRQES